TPGGRNARPGAMRRGMRFAGRLGWAGPARVLWQVKQDVAYRRTRRYTSTPAPQEAARRG
ncbi:MAG: hypothetical protein AAF328_01885, partial [Planctomycetota bacterium]